MNRQEERCYLEEELLMHLLNEELPDNAIKISNHLASCPSCKVVFNNLDETVKAVCAWGVEELPTESWESTKIQLMQHFRRDLHLLRSKGMNPPIFNILRLAWDYAIKSPIPAICFVAVVMAFASERTIEFFRLQPMMPSASQIVEMLRKVL
jgi:hypothetical protein